MGFWSRVKLPAKNECLILLKQKKKEKVIHFHLTRIIDKPHQFIQTLPLMIELRDKKQTTRRKHLKIGKRPLWHGHGDSLDPQIRLGLIRIRPSNQHEAFVYRSLHFAAGCWAWCHLGGRDKAFSLFFSKEALGDTPLQSMTGYTVSWSFITRSMSSG